MAISTGSDKSRTHFLRRHSCCSPITTWELSNFVHKSWKIQWACKAELKKTQTGLCIQAQYHTGTHTSLITLGTPGVVAVYCMHIRIGNNPNWAEARELWASVAPTAGTAVISWLATLASPNTAARSIPAPPPSTPLRLPPLSLAGHFTVAYALMHLIAQHLFRANSSKTWSSERHAGRNKFGGAISGGNLWMRLTLWKCSSSAVSAQF